MAVHPIFTIDMHDKHEKNEFVETAKNKLNAVQKSLNEAEEGQVFKAKNSDDLFRQLDKKADPF